MATKLSNSLFRNGAFLLLEAELAIVILLMIVMVALNSLNHLLKAQRDNENYLSALLIAEGKLSDIQAYGLNKTLEEDKLSDSDFSWSYTETELQNITDISQLDLSVGWQKRPRKGSFNLTTYLLNGSK